MTTAASHRKPGGRPGRLRSEHAPTGFTAWIFDLDGVLTDTAVLHRMAWKQVFDTALASLPAAPGENRVPFDPDEDYAAYVDGKPRQDGIRSFLMARGIALPQGVAGDNSGVATIEAIAAHKNRIFHDLLRNRGVAPLPGVRAFLSSLRGAGVRRAISSASRNCCQVLAHAGLTDWFEVVVDGVVLAETGLPGKPDPGGFLEAAKRLGVAPSHCAVVEDARAGVEAGRRGGFGLVVGIDHSGDRAALLEHGADLVVGSLQDLLTEGIAV